MALTMQNIVDRARIPLNDADPIDANRRDTDATLLAHAKGAIETLRNKRPDLFFGSFSALPGEALVLGDPFPLPDEYAPPVQDYVTARAQLKDDEAVAQSATTFFALFTGVGVE